ncbi:restriction endonuclease subunit S [Psychrobacter sp. H7-1]|uniref:restriction endonuclease subunit S n=1 Tax=Psychrobacter sp. H7-1 TaxID=1569265 RepID=UPI0019196A9A|nr:restriction endonuclease subunit S [Psychrobacter sp. H7-1]
MVSKWKELRLDEVTELIIDCPHSTPKWTDEGIVVLRSNNIKNGRLDVSSPSYTDLDGYEKRVKRAVPQAGDLVLTREAPMGEVCQIPEGLKCCLGQRMVLIRVKEEIIDSKYLLYTLQSPYLQYQISWNEGTGTTVSNIRIPNIKAFQIPTPLIPEQKAIAHILGTLDDKIELNRQMNETLEAMTQALFKSWFVDFDPVIDNALLAGKAIPDELAERAELRQAQLDSGKAKTNSEINDLFPSEFEFTEELGWIPKGWASKKLGELLNIKYGKDHKKLEQGSIPVYGSGGLMRSVDKSLYNGESILIPRKGTLSNLMYVDEEFWTVDTMFYSIPKQEKTVKYLFQCLSLFDLASMNVGSAVPSMTTRVLNDLNIVIPSNNALYEFDRLATDFFNHTNALTKQNSCLAKLRDTLLPKLMSGELRIADAEKLVADI